LLQNISIDKYNISTGKFLFSEDKERKYTQVNMVDSCCIH